MAALKAGFERWLPAYMNGKASRTLSPRHACDKCEVRSRYGSIQLSTAGRENGLALTLARQRDDHSTLRRARNLAQRAVSGPAQRDRQHERDR